MIFQRIAIARQIFTKEEIAELTKYELCLLWETAKQHVEWLAYALVVIVWTGVAAMFVALAKMPAFDESNSVVIEREAAPAKEQTESLRKLSQFEKTCAEIDKASLSSYTSESIYFKVIAASTNWEVDPVFVLALIEKESNFKEDAVAKDYDKTESLGWSQASKDMWDTFNAQYVWPNYNEAWPLEYKNDADKSLTFICWTINWLKAYYSSKVKTAHDLYAAYNGGPNGIHKRDVQANADAFDKIYSRYYVAMN